MLKTKFALALLTGLCCLGLQQARANHVDFMTDGIFTQTGAGNQDVAGAAGNILGAIRDVTITGGSASLAGTGPLVFNSGVGASDLVLGYGTPFSGGAFTANFITNAGPNWDSISVSITNVSVGASASLSLTVDSGGNQFTFASQNVTAAGNYVFLYSQAPGTINFASINGLRATLASGTPNSSYSIGGITRVTTVPEPSTWALAMGGGLSLLLLLRRRRTA